MNDIVEDEKFTPLPMTTKTDLPVVTISPMAMIAQAVANGASLDTIERLMVLQERVESNDARKAYVAAMAEFKAVELSIGKDKQVSFDTGKGKTEYKHATLGNIAETVGPILAQFGLSYRWETEQLDGGMVRVSCIVRHSLGHSEKTTLQAGLDASGGKNNIQSLGSTCSYLERYTLMAALGLASAEMDDDGRSQGREEPNYITEEQLAILQDMITKVPGDNLRNTQSFCKWLGVEALSELRTSDFKKAADAIHAKKGN